MTTGILGAGRLGQALAKRVVGAGMTASVCNRRGPSSLSNLVRELGPGIVAKTVQETAQADLVILAIPWEELPNILPDLAPWDGRIIVDATNPAIQRGYEVNLGGRTSSEVVADLVPDARLVKAFNTLPSAILGSNPRKAGGRRVQFLSGDDEDSKSDVKKFIDRLGFEPVDLGKLKIGGHLQRHPGGSLSGLDLIRLS